MKYSKLFILSIIIALSSCKKVVDLDLKNAESKIVVEANITNIAGPYFVKLTKTVPFDQTSVYPPVTNATVVITDNMGQSDILTYTYDGLYKTNTLQGIVGRTYELKIVADGNTYNATSTMPQYVPLDSLSVSVLPFGGQVNKLILPAYTDPIFKGNYYNFFITKNGKLSNIYSPLNDVANNGISNKRLIGDPSLALKTGDIVSVEMQCVNEIDYNYYFTLATMAFNGPGGGTTPANPPNNISNGALGLFSAHTTQTKTITIP